MAERTIPTTRELRGLALYRERGEEITRIWAHTWIVPSCSGEDTYVVRLDRETCDCPDFERNHAPCKHLFAAEIAASKSRARAKVGA
jgi:predicted nucleic acid-binding Zn finger protein